MARRRPDQERLRREHVFTRPFEPDIDLPFLASDAFQHLPKGEWGVLRFAVPPGTVPISVVGRVSSGGQTEDRSPFHTQVRQVIESREARLRTPFAVRAIYLDCETAKETGYDSRGKLQRIPRHGFELACDEGLERHFEERWAWSAGRLMRVYAALVRRIEWHR